MTDIFLEDRSANRSGCLRLLVVALVIGAVAFLIYKGCSGKENPDGTNPTDQTQPQQDQRTADLLAPDTPSGAGTQTPAPTPPTPGPGGDKPVPTR